MSTIESNISTENQIISLNIQSIFNVLPHKYPFLMVDRVTECLAGEYAKGYKNISVNEPQFQGHFPDVSIMPGVLQLEALAQMCCICMLQVKDYSVGYKGIFTGLDQIKFRKIVVPGDKLDIEVKKIKFRFPFGKFEVKATVNGEESCSGILSFAMIKNTEL
jgi:3-hydroxyacyl-[acyl-carrier-protein] dehydratase